MLVQAAGHAVIGLGLAAPLQAGLVGSVLLGLGTAMVYPALLAAVGDVAHPTWRATSVGVYRFWRDLGYAVGALIAGVVAAMFGLVWAVHVAGVLTMLSGLVAWALMNETLPSNLRGLRPRMLQGHRWHQCGVRRRGKLSTNVGGRDDEQDRDRHSARLARRATADDRGGHTNRRRPRAIGHTGEHAHQHVRGVNAPDSLAHSRTRHCRAIARW